MSNNILEIGNMTVTAYVGHGGGCSTQIAIGNWPNIQVAQLSSKETEELIMVLRKRLACAPGYSATD